MDVRRVPWMTRVTSAVTGEAVPASSTHSTRASRTPYSAPSVGAVLAVNSFAKEIDTG